MSMRPTHRILKLIEEKGPLTKPQLWEEAKKYFEEGIVSKRYLSKRLKELNQKGRIEVSVDYSKVDKRELQLRKGNFTFPPFLYTIKKPVTDKEIERAIKANPVTGPTRHWLRSQKFFEDKKKDEEERQRKFNETLEKWMKDTHLQRQIESERNRVRLERNFALVRERYGIEE